MQSLKAALVILEKFDSPDRENLYNRACFLAAISALTGTDEERDEAGDRAMKALRRAIAADIVTGTTSPKTPTSTRTVTPGLPAPDAGPGLSARPVLTLRRLQVVDADFPANPFSFSEQ